MSDKLKPKALLTDKELIEQLNKHPEIRRRVNEILRIAADDGHGQCNAHEIEKLLIEEVRQLGNETMRSWAGSVEAEVGHEMKRTGRQQSKKKG